MVSQHALNADSEHLLLEPGVHRVVISTPAAVELRDLASLRRDFALAHTFLEFYLASDIEGDEAIPSPLDALWISAITMYGRGFSTGRRHAARADTTHLTPTDAAAITSTSLTCAINTLRTLSTGSRGASFLQTSAIAKRPRRGYAK